MVLCSAPSSRATGTAPVKAVSGGCGAIGDAGVQSSSQHRTRRALTRLRDPERMRPAFMRAFASRRNRFHAARSG